MTATILGFFNILVACSVCYGDPDSDMAKGAIAGVAVLGLVILGVLGWVGGTAIYMVRRSRRVEDPNHADSDTFLY